MRMNLKTVLVSQGCKSERGMNSLQIAKIIAALVTLHVFLCTGCKEPQPVLHAYRYIDNTSLPVGSWVNYTCYQNYYWISGDLKRECEGGVLTGQPPVCKDKKILNSDKLAVPTPSSLNGREIVVTDGNEETCESTTRSTSPSWMIEFDGIKEVFSVELIWGPTSNFGLDAIYVYVKNINSITDCGILEVPPLSSNVVINCSPARVGTHVIIQGTFGAMSSLELCEIKAIGKDWTYECGDPPSVYGAEVTSNTTSGEIVTVQYSCVEGFYYGGKNPESTCRDGYWTKVNILCLPYDSLYNPQLSPFNTVYGPLVDDDENTCVEMADEVIASLNYRRLAFKLYAFKLVELLSVTVTIGVSETWDDLEFVGVPIGTIEAPPCEYDGLSTDPYRVRTFFCQPYAYSQILFIIIRDVSSNLKEFCEIKSTIRTDTKALECIREEYINEYKGKMNYTWDGKHCDNWTDAPPEKAINTTIHKTFDPDSELNYCRNIGGEKKRPWCWVDNFQSIGYCPLAFCDEICHLKEEYTEYKGQQPFSTSGKQCREWSDGNKEGREFLSEVFSDGVQAGSYCRNPGYSQFRAWCYVEDPFSTIVPEPCAVPYCPTDFLWLTVRNNETSIYPIYLHQCYNPLDSFNVRHYFDLTIEESTINNLCRYFQDELLFCFTGGDWTRIEFECFDVPPETTFIAETSSPSPETTFLMDETSTNFIEESSSIETSSIFEISSTVETSSSIVESSSVDASSPIETSSLVDASSSIETSSLIDASSLIESSSLIDASSSMIASSLVDASSSIETSSLVDASSSIETSSLVDASSSIETSSLVDTSSSMIASSSIDARSSMDTSSSATSAVEDIYSTSNTIQTTHSLDPSFSVSSADTSSITSDLLGTTGADIPSNTPVIFSTTITVTQTMVADSSSFWYESSNNDSSSNMTCGCFCIRDDLLNYSDPVVKARLEFLTQGLEMDYEKLSATIRKRISVEDDRPSVTYVGSSALTMMLIFLAVIVFPDVINLFQFLHRRWLYTKQPN